MFRRRRETMIALRARHEALEVTRDIAYPPLQVPPPPAPPIPVVSGDWDVSYEPPPRPAGPPVYVEYVYAPAPEPSSTLGRALMMSDVALSLLAILLGIGVILLCKYG